MEKIVWEVSSFDGLDVYTLYKIIKLRIDTFVVEQGGVYPDLDDKDQIALHLMGYIDEELIGYCRLFKAGDSFEQASIGRVIVPAKFRRKGYGHILMEKAIEVQSKLLNENDITISAQYHLKSFYEMHGFIQTSEKYQEDGIPHIRMRRKTESE